MHKEHFVLSDFPRDSNYFCNDNKKIPGKMKDENTGKIIYEGEFLKSKNVFTKNCRWEWKKHS